MTDEDRIQEIAERIGYGRVQQIAGDLWEKRYDCAPRGRMGVSVRTNAETDALRAEVARLQTQLTMMRAQGAEIQALRDRAQRAEAEVSRLTQENTELKAYIENLNAQSNQSLDILVEKTNKLLKAIDDLMD
jgi:DNA anti-recombination protein RmuC